MYYVNREQIEANLNFIPQLIAAFETLQQSWDGADPLHVLAQERALHLAIESVTDIGSFIIDGFMMRDAGSYEDIVEILSGEGVFPLTIAEPLQELVRWRRPLVQGYLELPRGEVFALVEVLPAVLSEFCTVIRAYLSKELDQ